MIRFVLLALVTINLISNNSYAVTLSSLERSGQVSIKAWLGTKAHEPNEEFTVHEQITLFVEVGTSTWFTGGTVIGRLDVDNALVKQRTSSATNFTEVIQGITWSKQLWERQLYPQQAGEYYVPELSVSLQVSTSGRDSAIGVLYTPPLRFQASIPDPILLQQNEAWFSASQVELKQEWLDSREENLKVGDSVTRSVTINAQDTLSILLPTHLNDSKQASYSAYASVAERNDTYDRGDYQSSVQQQQTIILQEGGDLVLPDIQYVYWDIDQLKVQQQVLLGRTIHVKHTLNSWFLAYSVPLFVVAVCLAIVLVLITLSQRYPRYIKLPARYYFELALYRHNYSQARCLLYRKQRQLNENTTLYGLEKRLTTEENKALQTQDTRAAIYRRSWQAIKVSRKHKFQLTKALPSLNNLNADKTNNHEH